MKTNRSPIKRRHSLLTNEQVSIELAHLQVAIFQIKQQLETLRRTERWLRSINRNETK